MTLRLNACIGLVVALLLSACDPGVQGRSRLYPSCREHPENARFLETFAKDGNYYVLPIIREDMWSWPAFGVVRDIEDHTDKILTISFYSPPDPEQPIMQLRIRASSDRRDGLPGNAHPQIFADLNRVQADHVIADGVPESLIETMVQTARENDWVPERVDPTFGVRVDPSPYFPDLKKG